MARTDRAAKARSFKSNKSVIEANTIEGIAAAIQELSTRDGLNEGVTVQEIAKEWGRSTDYVRKQLRVVMDAGRLETTRRSIVAINGQTRIITGYKIKE
jgi:precorrin-6B methylase 2